MQRCPLPPAPTHPPTTQTRSTTDSTSSNGYAYTAYAALTQLRDLTLYTPWISEYENECEYEEEEEEEEKEPALHLSMQGEGPAVLRQLAGLTSLRCFPEHTDWDEDPPDLWQAQLASALTALSRLQHLAVQRVWDGPVATALGHVTSLTKLETSRQQPWLPSGLRLPGLKVFSTEGAGLDFLTALEAPNLQHLRGRSPTDPFSLSMQVGDAKRVQRQAVLLEQCARGPLRCCNRLEIWGSCRRGRDGVAVVDMQALGKYWRPDPSLVDSSSPHVQPGSSGARAGAQPPAGGWHLTREAIDCTKATLAALPKGLTRLELT
jgi:hypothetical protein